MRKDDCKIEFNVVFVGHFSFSGQSPRRESMVLLEYQAMPFLRDVANDGWLCTFTI